MLKADGPAAYESTLERDFITLLEFSPEVEALKSSPSGWRWSDAAGSLRCYTPDTLVRFGRSSAGATPWLCEVKYRADLAGDWHGFASEIQGSGAFLHGARMAFQNHH